MGMGFNMWYMVTNAAYAKLADHIDGNYRK